MQLFICHIIHYYIILLYIIILSSGRLQLVQNAARVLTRTPPRNTPRIEVTSLTPTENYIFFLKKYLDYFVMLTLSTEHKLTENL